MEKPAAKKIKETVLFWIWAFAVTAYVLPLSWMQGQMARGGGEEGKFIMFLFAFAINFAVVGVVLAAPAWLLSSFLRELHPRSIRGLLRTWVFRIWLLVLLLTVISVALAAIQSEEYALDQLWLFASAPLGWALLLMMVGGMVGFVRRQKTR